MAELGKKINVLFFGDSPTEASVKKALSNKAHYNIVGSYDKPEAGKEYPKQEEVDIIVVSSDMFYKDHDAMNLISQRYLIKGTLLRTDVNAYDRVLCRIPIDGLKDFSWLVRRMSNREHHHTYVFVKRFFDIVCSLSMLIVLALPLLAMLLLIKLVEGYDPIFTQERVGMLEKPINIFKFRTMVPGTERITKLGRILRRFRIDEMPQLFNILKGDISFVGPRPLYIREYQVLNRHVPNHFLRTIVRPGLTGWSQLNFKAPPTYCVIADLPSDRPDEETYKDAYTRLSYDLWYIENESFSLDIQIFLRTLKRSFIKDSSLEE